MKKEFQQILQNQNQTANQQVQFFAQKYQLLLFSNLFLNPLNLCLAQEIYIIYSHIIQMDQHNKNGSSRLKSIRFCQDNPSNYWSIERPFPSEEKIKKYNYSTKDLFEKRFELPIPQQDLVSKDSRVSFRNSSVQHSGLAKKRNESLLNPQPLNYSRKRSVSSISSALHIFDNSEFFLKSTFTQVDLSKKQLTNFSQISQDFTITPLKKLSINKFKSDASTQDASGKKKNEISQIYYIDQQLEKVNENKLKNSRTSNFSDLFKRVPQPQPSFQKFGQEQDLVCAELFSSIKQFFK